MYSQATFGASSRVVRNFCLARPVIVGVASAESGSLTSHFARVNISRSPTQLAVLTSSVAYSFISGAIVVVASFAASAMLMGPTAAVALLPTLGSAPLVSCEGCAKRLNGTGGTLFDVVIADVPSGQIHVREKVSGYSQTCTTTFGSVPCNLRKCDFTWELEAWGTGGMGDEDYDTLEVEETTPPASPVTYNLPEGVNARITVLGPVEKSDVTCGYSTRRIGTLYNPTHMLTPYTYTFVIGCKDCIQ